MKHKNIVSFLVIPIMVIALGVLFLSEVVPFRKTNVAVSEAWNDDFEVIVQSKNGETKLMYLADAMKSLSANNSFLLKAERSGFIIDSIIADHKIHHHIGSVEGYPFGDLDIKEITIGAQHITYSVYYRFKTFEYSYNAYIEKIEPLYYSISDPGGTNIRYYE